MHTDTIPDLTIAVDFGTSLPDMIAAGTYDRVDPDITPEKFLSVATGTKKFRTKVFGFDRSISSEDAVGAMKGEGFAPASHLHGVAFGATFPDEQRKYQIACLGSFALMYGRRRVVYLYKYGRERFLGLYGWDGPWAGRWRFLGVQEVSDA
jgi:hypothetical protein